MAAQADPQLSAEAAKAVAEIYQAAQVELLALLGRYTARGIDQPGWAARRAAQLAALEADAKEHVARLAAGVANTARAAVETAWTAGAAAAAAEVGIDLEWGTINRQAVERLAAELAGQLASTHVQILRSTVDGYRQVVAEASAQAVTGTWTTRQAAQRALDRLADRGITGFVDRAGRRWGLDSYTEMATRTATGRAQVAGTLERFTTAGRDLVIVSDHAGECPVCRPWEGRVLSISGRTAGYPTVAEATAAGLMHAQCRHVLGLYVPGLSEPMPGPTADPEGYEVRQWQRYLERGVRRWKRKEAVAITPQAHRLARAKRLEWQARLDEHIDAHGLKRLRDRESLRVSKIERVELDRIAAARKALAAQERRVVPTSAAWTVKPRTRMHVGRAGRASAEAAMYREARGVLDRIGKLHRVPPSARPGLLTVERNVKVGGQPAYGKFNRGTRQITLDVDHGTRLTIAHEFGHYLDWEALGRRAGRYASVAGELGAWATAVDASPTVQAFRAWAATRPAGNQADRYWLSPAELWARSYAQWVAVRINDPKMLATLVARVGIHNGGYWPATEFGPIGQAIDALLLRKGKT
ncbi:MAG: hypothetical protein IT197_05605 [Acidimicrobiia bacterium]|nr:hypothetical protein [Acidimicrobiia bacterium]